METIKKLQNLFNQFKFNKYINHELLDLNFKTAYIAMNENLDDELIISCLFLNFGRFLNNDQKKDINYTEIDVIGAEYLKQFNITPRFYLIVSNFLEAKRYNCKKNINFFYTKN